MSLRNWVKAFGTDLAVFPSAVKGFRRYWKDYRRLREQNSQTEAQWYLKPSYPCLMDFYDQSGEAHGHYFHQDLLIAQKICSRNPRKHVDVGSRVDGFVAHVAAFRELEVLDSRHLQAKVPNVTFYRYDLLDLPARFTSYCDSLSCLHVIEHIGLGRYSDTVDIDGHAKAINNLRRMLQPGGILYLSVPFGRERIEFNAHRVFSLTTVRNMLHPGFKIVGFSYVDDSGDVHRDADILKVIDLSPPPSYSLAILELEKLEGSGNA